MTEAPEDSLPTSDHADLDADHSETSSSPDDRAALDSIAQSIEETLERPAGQSLDADTSETSGIDGSAD